MRQSIDETIRHAIRAKRLLIFMYRGRLRVVEPHVYGINTAKHTVLSAWQTNRASKVSPPNCWRTYFINHMRRVEVLPIAFDAARETYNPQQPQIAVTIEGIPPATTSPADASSLRAPAGIVDPRQLELDLGGAGTTPEK